MAESNKDVVTNPRRGASTSLWFLHNPPNPTGTHSSLKDLHDLWPNHEATVTAGKRKASVRHRLATQVTIDGATVTVPGESALIAEDNSILVTAPRLDNPQKFFKSIIEYLKTRTKNPRATTRILITALPVIAGVTYVVLSKPNQSSTILIGGLTSITGAIAYNSYYLGIHLRRNELTNFLESRLGDETRTQGKALDHTIATIRQGYDEITRQLTVRALIGEGCVAERAEMLATIAIEKGPRHATTLAPEHHQALQILRPDQAKDYVTQLFPDTRQQKIEQLLTIR